MKISTFSIKIELINMIKIENIFVISIFFNINKQVFVYVYRENGKK